MIKWYKSKESCDRSSLDRLRKSLQEQTKKLEEAVKQASERDNVASK